MLEQSLSGRSHRKVNYEDFECYIDSVIEQLSLPGGNDNYHIIKIIFRDFKI